LHPRRQRAAKLNDDIARSNAARQDLACGAIDGPGLRLPTARGERLPERARTAIFHDRIRDDAYVTLRGDLEPNSAFLSRFGPARESDCPNRHEDLQAI